MDKPFWQAILDSGYAVPAGHTAAQLTPELLSYLGSADAELRDRYAYFILGTWIERGHYGPDALREMLAQLARNLKQSLGDADTDTVFLRAFSALIMAEILAYDEEHPFLRPEEVLEALRHALEYLVGERDLRGYVPVSGWAHSCAHTADLLRVLAENRHLKEGDLELLLDGIAVKVTTPVPHPYLHDEDERLVRAVMAVLHRETVKLPFLMDWLEHLANPAGRRTWIEAFLTEHDLGARHNTKQFLRSLYLQLSFSESPPPITPDLLPGVAAALHAIRPWA